MVKATLRDGRDTRVAMKITSFARALDRSRQWVYALPEELQPKTIKVGRARFVIEQPADFLRRLAEAR